MTRCADCLGDFAPLDRRFVIYPEMGITDDGEPIPLGREEVVCGDCAGWYRDAVEVSAAEVES